MCQGKQVFFSQLQTIRPDEDSRCHRRAARDEPPRCVRLRIHRRTAAMPESNDDVVRDSSSTMRGIKPLLLVVVVREGDVVKEDVRACPGRLLLLLRVEGVLLAEPDDVVLAALDSLSSEAVSVCNCCCCSSVCMVICQVFVFLSSCSSVATCR